MQRLTLGLAALLACLVILPASALATSSPTEIDTAVDKAADFARGQQDPLTGEPFGFNHGSFSSDWLATSLAAAGVHAADVKTAGNPSLQDFLLDDYIDFWSGPPTGAVSDYERVTLVSSAAGLDPARLSTHLNLPAQIAGRWNPATGSFGEASTNTAVFGILALKTTPLPSWALAPAVSFLRQRQHDDGGWTFSGATGAALAEASEEDMTGAAIAALCEAGVPAYDPDVAAALSFLQGRLINASGGIKYRWGFPPDSPNADVNAWVVSGLNACRVDPQSSGWTTAANKTPIDYLLSLQVPSGAEAGGFGYESAAETPNLYSTQDALRAIAGGVFTAAPPARENPAEPRVRPVPAVAPGTPVPHLLAIELAPGNVRICQATVATGAPLTELLAAAEAESYPAGCVTSFSTDGKRVQSIDGVSPEGGDEAWLLRLDRGSAAIAADQPIAFGEMVSLRLGRPTIVAGAPQGAAGAPGPTGPQGTTGRPGKAGKRGAKGKPGRSAHRKVCKARRTLAGKRRGRCKSTHRRGQTARGAVTRRRQP